MSLASPLSLCSQPKVYSVDHKRDQVFLDRQLVADKLSASFAFSPLRLKNSRRKVLLSRRSVVEAVGGSSYSGGASRPNSRRVYRQSQVEVPTPVRQIASVVLPTGAFVVVTFVLWKLVEKVLVPKPVRSSNEESKTSQGLKWSIAAGTNILSNFGAKVEIESRQKLNDFAKELRLFQSVDMSGRNLGDDGFYFLAKSLAYNQTAEEVNFAANGITADGLKALDGILQSNITLKTLNLSGNAIGDEGAKCLCDILVENASIQKLQLNSAGIGDEGAKAVGEMLKKNSTLRILELNNNLIDYSGFSGLAAGLLDNKSVQTLYLNGNYGGPLGAASLAKGLEGTKSIRHVTRYSRKSLRVLGSVGEPINPSAWRWFFNVVGDSRCPISDTWWQTETGGFMITPLPGAWPQKPGSATFPFFGIQPVVVDEKGGEIEGECSGYLCVKRSWPGMFRTIYGDHERYETAYFSAFSGYYFSGDGCNRDKDGYYWLTGRVDDVINVSGHRIGTAEVESALVSHPKCSEAAVVGVEHEVKGQGIYAFVTLVEGVSYSEDLRKSLIASVRNQIGAFAAPDKIHWAPGLPKTRSGKIMRRILRKIASRQLNELGDTSTLADPNVVDQLIALADC